MVATFRATLGCTAFTDRSGKTIPMSEATLPMGGGCLDPLVTMLPGKLEEWLSPRGGMVPSILLHRKKIRVVRLSDV